MSKRSTLAGTVIILLLASTATADIRRFKATKGYQTYTVRKPVLTVNPGDTVETNTLYSEWFAGQFTTWLGEAGPIHVRGAEPGDTLTVKILKIRPNVARRTSRDVFELRVDHRHRNHGHAQRTYPIKKFIWAIAADGRTATLELPGSRLKRVRVDLDPMLGRLATAPPEDQAIPGGVPSTFGGNMDTPEAREGTTISLPVYHPGACFYWGDVHALQGDGEISGMGIETSADVAFEFGLIKGKKIAWPRLENAEYIRVAGSARPLIDAFRIAHVEMVKWLESEYGFDRWEALEVFSQVGKAGVANVVDPNYTVVAKFPKKYLPP